MEFVMVEWEPMLAKLRLTNNFVERTNKVTEFAEAIQNSIYDMTDEWYGIHTASGEGKAAGDDAAWRELRRAPEVAA